MNQEKKISTLMKEVEGKLAQIRRAMEQGNRQAAVQLAAERYQLMKKIEDLKKEPNLTFSNAHLARSFAGKSGFAEAI